MGDFSSPMLRFADLFRSEAVGEPLSPADHGVQQHFIHSAFRPVCHFGPASGSPGSFDLSVCHGNHRCHLWYGVVEASALQSGDTVRDPASAWDLHDDLSPDKTAAHRDIGSSGCGNSAPGPPVFPNDRKPDLAIPSGTDRCRVCFGRLFPPCSLFGMVFSGKHHRANSL